jgi:hypothetical protein
MRLYHFTALEYLKSILEQGLTRGDVPLGPRRFGNAVWLTQNPDPEAQVSWAGSGERVLTDEDRAAYEAIFGVRPPAGSRFPDKRAVMLEVEVPEDDPNLVRWIRYARLRGASKCCLRQLRSSPDWFIYKGTIPPEWIVKVGLSGEAAEALQAWGPEGA